MTGNRILAFAASLMMLMAPVSGMAGELVGSQQVVPYPPLVTDIQNAPRTVQHSTAQKGAAAGASGFPARPDGAVGAGAAVLTTLGVLGLIGLGIAAALPESSSTSSGGSDNSSAVSTN